jgi:hypothetical protein
MLSADEGVIQLLGLGLGSVEYALQLTAQAGLSARPCLSRKAADFALHLLAYGGHVETCLLEQRLYHALVLGQKGSEQMGVVHDWVTA